jgi:predicted DNA-binding transcriptional regulator YafY
MRIEGRETDRALVLVCDVLADDLEVNRRMLSRDLERDCQMPRLSCHVAAARGEGAGHGRRGALGVSPPLGPHTRLVPENSLGAEVAGVLR